MSCIICFDEMDMAEYNDNKSTTETCFKLDCGHAYHTKCIIEYLSKTDHKCPNCNTHKTEEQTVQREFIIRKFVSEIIKDKRVKLAKKKKSESLKEYQSVLRKLKKEAREWVSNRAKELQVQQYKSSYYKVSKNVFNIAKQVAKELGTNYVGALCDKVREHGTYGVSLVKRLLYGTDVVGWHDWRLRNPRFCCTIK
jgi:hypothetical protein